MNPFTLLITMPLGWLLDVIYRVVQNYGVAIIFFTIVIKLLLLPLSLKSQKAMTKQQKLAPQLAEIQKKYANDKEKLNKETMTLYKENGANPASGCLPMLLQLPIIFALYQVVQKPISYMHHVSFATEENINKVIELQQQVAASEVLQTKVPAGFLTSNMKQLADNFQIAMSNVSQEIGGQFADWGIHFNFLGMNLSRYPSEGWAALNSLVNGRVPNNIWETLPLLLIPILSGVSSWMMGKMTPKAPTAVPADGAADDAASKAAGTAKTMQLMMPLISVIFTFSLPSGIGMYWIISNLIQIVQQHYTMKYFKKKEENTIVIDTVAKNRKDRKKRR